MNDASTVSQGRLLLRLGLLALVVIALVAIARASGLGAQLDLHGIQATVREAGPWGVLVFLAASALGGVLHVPGVAFLLAGPLLYGELLGGALAWIGALLYAEANFLLIRGLGGQPLASLKRPLFRRLIDWLNRRPLMAVAVIRATFWMAAPANYTLAMSSVGGRDHLIGSALGLLPAAAVNALFVDWAVRAWS